MNLAQKYRDEDTRRALEAIEPFLKYAYTFTLYAIEWLKQGRPEVAADCVSDMLRNLKRTTRHVTVLRRFADPLRPRR